MKNTIILLTMLLFSGIDLHRKATTANSCGQNLF